MTDIHINNAFFLALFTASGLLIVDGAGRLLVASAPATVGLGPWMGTLLLGV